MNSQINTLNRQEEQTDDFWFGFFIGFITGISVLAIFAIFTEWNLSNVQVISLGESKKGQYVTLLQYEDGSRKWVIGHLGHEGEKFKHPKW